MTEDAEFGRKYLDSGFDPSDIAQVRRAFEELEARPLEDIEALERWCCDCSELMAATGEEGMRRYVDSTCHTGDPEVRARYLAWVEELEPEIKERGFALDRRLAGHPQADELPEEEFAVFLRSVRNWVELYRGENIPLETEEAVLSRDYDELVGARTVVLEGEELTVPRAYRYLERQDRGMRERAWRAVNERAFQDREKVEEIFEGLLGLRQQIARNAGFEEYRAYRFREMDRFDYTPEDCERLHRSIEEVAVPVQIRLAERRARKLGLECLRPWDYAVDPEGRQPLSPFETVDELLRGARATFAAVAPEFGAHFDRMLDAGLLDLESRKGKAAGAYKASMWERRLPFIFLNAAGTHTDVTTLFHEGGHAFHDLEYRHQRLMPNRNAPSEFAEVASMSMELLASTHLERSFYDEAGARRARTEHLENILTSFSWTAVIDAFQHWVYLHPGHGREERTGRWMELLERFQPDADWQGLEHLREVSWQKVGHLFDVPFYMLEYAIAQLGALQVWRNYLEDPAEAVARLRDALSLGYTRPLPQLYEAAGIRFDFSAQTLGELLAFAEERYEELLAA